MTSLLSKPHFDFWSLNDFDDHKLVITLTDKSTGLKGFIAIHHVVSGNALGGTRLQSYASPEDALIDVLNLSKAMSYKCALAGLPYGGGKGVIIKSNTTEHTNHNALKTYARMVENLHGLFKTGTDVGITEDDVRMMSQYTSHMLGVSKADRGGLSTSKAAALGVFYSIVAAMIESNGSSDITGKRVAIKGVGKLGSELSRLLYEAGAKVLIADINQKQIYALSQRLPNVKTVDVQEIHKQDVEIYAPCALGHDLTEKVIRELRCRAVVGGANNQLPSAQEGELLFRQGILYAPDYIANAGGLIYVADELEPDGFNKTRVLQRIASIQDTMLNIFKRSREERLPTFRIADLIAQERLKNGLLG